MLVAVDLQLLLCAPDGVKCFCNLRYIFFHCSLAACLTSTMPSVADHLSVPYTFLLPRYVFFPDGGAVRDSQQHPMLRPIWCYTFVVAFAMTAAASWHCLRS